jgi:hypothetical protein
LKSVKPSVAASLQAQINFLPRNMNLLLAPAKKRQRNLSLESCDADDGGGAAAGAPASGFDTIGVE